MTANSIIAVEVRNESDIRSQLPGRAGIAPHSLFASLVSSNFLQDQSEFEMAKQSLVAEIRRCTEFSASSYVAARAESL